MDNKNKQENAPQSGERQTIDDVWNDIKNSRISEPDGQLEEIHRVLSDLKSRIAELEASNAKLREALECVRSMSSSVSIEQNRKIRFFITEALNSKDAGGE